MRTAALRMTIAGLTAATMVAGAATADDAANGDVIFENSVSGDAGNFVNLHAAERMTDALYTTWQVAYHAYSDALYSYDGRNPAELEALLDSMEIDDPARADVVAELTDAALFEARVSTLLDAANSAAVAYEASLVEANVVMLSSAGMEPLTDEMLAALID